MKKVLVVLANGFEELEAITVADLCVRAGFDVVRAGLTKGAVTASRGTVVLPDAPLTQVIDQPFDAIVLPGGLPGADHLSAHSALLQRLQTQAENKQLIAAICAAPRALLAAGLLDGKRFTSFPGALDALAASSSALQNTGAAVEVDWPLITSRGPGTAIDFSLAIIEALGDTQLREQVEEGLVR